MRVITLIHSDIGRREKETDRHHRKVRMKITKRKQRCRGRNTVPKMSDEG